MSDQLSALAAQYGGAPVGSAAPAPGFKTSNVPVDVPRDARGRPRVSSSLSDGPPSTVDQLNEMLGPLAHPQTLSDFASLLGVNVDHVRKAVDGALAIAASRGPVGRFVSAVGRGAEAVGNSRAAGAAEKLGGAEAVFHLDPKGLAVAAAPTVLRTGGRLLQRAGAFVSGPARALEPTIGEAAAAAPAAAVEAAPAETSAAKALDGGPVVAHPSPQQVASEAAITARRAAYQARQAAAASAPAEEAPAWTPTKIRLTAEESKVAAKLIQQGKTDAEVQQAIEAARAFQQRYGTPTPTAAEQRFAKGTRGGAR